MGAFDVNIGVIAHAVGTYAWDLSSLRRPVPAAERPAAGTTATGGTGAHEATA
jgi:hypothetical protein